MEAEQMGLVYVSNKFLGLFCVPAVTTKICCQVCR